MTEDVPGDGEPVRAQNRKARGLGLVPRDAGEGRVSAWASPMAVVQRLRRARARLTTASETETAARASTAMARLRYRTTDDDV